MNIGETGSKRVHKGKWVKMGQHIAKKYKTSQTGSILVIKRKNMCFKKNG